ALDLRPSSGRRDDNRPGSQPRLPSDGGDGSERKVLGVLLHYAIDVEHEAPIGEDENALTRAILPDREFEDTFICVKVVLQAVDFPTAAKLPAQSAAGLGYVVALIGHGGSPLVELPRAAEYNPLYTCSEPSTHSLLTARSD